MKKHDMIIGIDPDVDKSGVAELNISTREVEWFSLTFPLLIDYLRSIRKKHLQNESVLVVVEAGWLNKKSCFHDAQGRKAERLRLTMRDDATRETFDSKAFKAEHPEMWDKYVKYTTVKGSLTIKITEQ